MKSLIILGRIVGIISFLLCIVLLLARFTKPRGYPERLVEDFGTPERIAQLTRLYERVEAAPAAEELQFTETSQACWLPREEISSIRSIPVSWLPADIGVVWRNPASGGGYGSTFAYYDASGGLLGIEFRGSRHGGFLSRSAPPFAPYFERFSSYNRGKLWIIGGYSLGD